MKITPSSRRYHYLVRFGAFLVAVAFIVGMVACPPSNGDEEVLPPFSLFSLCIDFEDLPLAAEYHVGNTFTVSGVDIDGTTVDVNVVVKAFQAENLTWCGTPGYDCGCATVEEGLEAGGAGQEMGVGNVNLGLSYNGPWEVLYLQFGEYGGNINIDVNGVFENVDDFDDLPPLIGGVSVSVVNGSGQYKGSLTLSGTINSFEIGGQELWIDNVCLNVTS